MKTITMNPLKDDLITRYKKELKSYSHRCPVCGKDVSVNDDRRPYRSYSGVSVASYGLFKASRIATTIPYKCNKCGCGYKVREREIDFNKPTKKDLKHMRNFIRDELILSRQEDA